VRSATFARCATGHDRPEWAVTIAGIRSKPRQNHQLLMHMATGSGKTMMMAGLIAYLYAKGYRKFLFFVNSTNIINKTRDNFLNPLLRPAQIQTHCPTQYQVEFGDLTRADLGSAIPAW